MQTDILTYLSENRHTFSRGQKKIADYILKNFDKAAFLTAGKLAGITEISESTVVRFAADLGYSGYPAMREALQDVFRSRQTSIQRAEIANEILREEEDALTAVLNTDIANLRLTLDSIDREAFKNAVGQIASAERVYIMGLRTSATLASFLGFYLDMLLENVKLVHEYDEVTMTRFRPTDVFIGISFPRYSRRTVEAIHTARNKGASVIAITDTNTSPIAKAANYNIFAKSRMVSFADSMVAALSVINALIAAVGIAGKARLAERLEELEQLWLDHDIYEV
ncbi:MAG: MurR/RpiR family transcriptional regulator [Oscillospiraceae bacterium]|jgi:DNA-binding MurR/RpiR family transcriptional regulator|nr:MurR/RpiR family transcriptional regulator [Oscillospiraceae bacterium]